MRGQSVQQEGKDCGIVVVAVVGVKMLGLRCLWVPSSGLGTALWRCRAIFPRQFVRCQGSLTLRDYQQHVIDKCIHRIIDRHDSNGRIRLGVSLATGGGKTVIFSNLINQLALAKKCQAALILVHRRELVQQAAATIRKCVPNCHVLIEMGTSSVPEETVQFKGATTVIIASVQSLVRRIDKYSGDFFDLIIIDEAHHSVANSYQSVLNHFNDGVPRIGFSATFERADNKALSTVIDEIVYHRGILEMIGDKWLCEGKFTQVKVDYDLSKVGISSVTNDFKIERLSQVMNNDRVNEIIVQTYIHKNGIGCGRGEKNFKSTLLFAIDISHVNSLQRKFAEHDIKVSSVTSATRIDERDRIVREFKLGNIQVLINCGIFTEGTDMPNIDCILLCRPTRSRSLLIQMIGRGLRLHHSKKHCSIIDFTGNTSQVGVVSVPTLAGIENYDDTLEDATIQDLQSIKDEFQFNEGKREEKEIAAQKSFDIFLDKMDAFDLTLSSFETFRSYHDHFSISDAAATEIPDSLNELNLFYNSRYPWAKFSDNAWALSLQNNHHLRVYKKDGNYSLRLYREIPSYLRDTTNTKFVPRELIIDENLLKIIGKVEQVMEKLTETNKDDNKVKNLTKFARWRYEPATPKQKNFIKKRLTARSTEFSVPVSDIESYIQKLTKGQASNILFACNLAPVYPIKSLLRIVKYKKTA